MLPNYMIFSDVLTIDVYETTLRGYGLGRKAGSRALGHWGKFCIDKESCWQKVTPSVVSTNVVTCQK